MAGRVHSEGETMQQITKAASILCFAMLGLGGSALADSNDPIKIAVNEWTGQHVSAILIGSLLSATALPPSPSIAKQRIVAALVICCMVSPSECKRPAMGGRSSFFPIVTKTNH